MKIKVTEMVALDNKLIKIKFNVAPHGCIIFESQVLNMGEIIYQAILNYRQFNNIYIWCVQKMWK